MISTHAVDTPGHRLGHIMADHHALRREADDLMVLAEHGRDLDHPLRTALVERLSRLGARLQVHFALEEEGGYLREVLARRPGLGVHVARLEHEHEVMLADAAVLSHQLLTVPPPYDVRARIVRLLETLREHELAEHDLIQEALVVDLGGGD